MANQKGIIVQFIYLTPHAVASDFRMREVTSERISIAWSNLGALAASVQDPRSPYQVLVGLKDRPWLNCQPKKERSLSQEFAVVYAVVWDNLPNNSGINVHIPSDFAPAPLEHQPENRFWIIDIIGNYVVATGRDLNGAKQAFAEILDGLSAQLNA